MSRKSSDNPRTQRVERPQKNGGIYVYEVTTLYGLEKCYNEQAWDAQAVI